MEWREGKPEKVDEYVDDLNKFKDSLYRTISELKEKKKELLLKMEEEKVKDGWVAKVRVKRFWRT